VICSTEYEQSDWELTRRSFQLVRSYEEICGAFGSKNGRRPQRLVSGERRLFDISPVSTSGVYESGWQRSKRWSTSQHLHDGWSRL